MFVYVCNGLNGKFPRVLSVDMREAYINLIRHDHFWLKWAYTSETYNKILCKTTSDGIDPAEVARQLEDCLDSLAVNEFNALYTKAEITDNSSKIYYDVYKYPSADRRVLAY